MLIDTSYMKASKKTTRVREREELRERLLKKSKRTSGENRNFKEAP